MMTTATVTATATATSAVMTISADERARRLRGRNLATLAALIGMMVLFYAITVVRMGGH